MKLSLTSGSTWYALSSTMRLQNNNACVLIFYSNCSITQKFPITIAIQIRLVIRLFSNNPRNVFFLLEFKPVEILLCLEKPGHRDHHLQVDEVDRMVEADPADC